MKDNSFMAFYYAFNQSPQLQPFAQIILFITQFSLFFRAFYYIMFVIMRKSFITKSYKERKVFNQ